MNKLTGLAGPGLVATVYGALFLCEALHGQVAGALDRVSDIVLPQQVPNSQVAALYSLGERLRKLGKERTVLTGSITRGTEAVALAVTRENGDKIRIDEAGSRTSVSVFDGSKGSFDQKQSDSEDLLETALMDSAEHFLMAGVPGSGKRNVLIRYLGSGFGIPIVAQEKSAATGYQVFELSETIQLSDTPVRRTKLYYFNQQTRLLDRVQYNSLKAGREVTVQVALSAWTDFQGEKFPLKVIRSENGTAVLTLNFAQATTSAKVQDQKFGSF